MRNRTILLLGAIAAASLLAGCASVTNPCKSKYGGLCTSPREMYGVTRNRDQVNPPKDVLKNQQRAQKLINTQPKPSEKLPSIVASKAMSRAAAPAAAATPSGSKLPSTVLAARSAQKPAPGPGGVVDPPQPHGPYMTGYFGGQNTPLPLLRQPKVIRVWVAPYVGQNDQLHFPGYIYSVIQPRTWTFGYGSQSATPPMPAPGQVTPPPSSGD